MTIVVIIGYIVFPSIFRSTVVNTETVVKSFLFLPCYARNGNIFPVYSIGWTLNLEMFYYLLFFAAMKINHRLRGRIAVGMTGALIVFGLLYHPENAILKFWTSTRLINFIVGVGIYGLSKRLDRIELNRVIAAAGIVVSILFLFSGRYMMGEHFDVLWNTFWGGVLLFFCLPLKNVSVNPLMKTLGDMSYSIYMTHFMIIGTVCRMLIDNTRMNVQNTMIVIAAMVIAVACSWLVYMIFEKFLVKTILRTNRT